MVFYVIWYKIHRLRGKDTKESDCFATALLGMIHEPKLPCRFAPCNDTNEKWHKKYPAGRHGISWSPFVIFSVRLSSFSSWLLWRTRPDIVDSAEDPAVCAKDYSGVFLFLIFSCQFSPEGISGIRHYVLVFFQWLSPPYLYYGVYSHVIMPEG